MLFLSLNDKDKDGYIVDFIQEGNNLKVKYADGKEIKQPYSSELVEIYRDRMEKQVSAYIKDYRDYITADFRSYGLRKILMIIIDICSLYLVYNYSKETWLKIIFTLILMYINYRHFIMTTANMIVDVRVAVEAQALEYFINHKEEFDYVSSMTHEKTSAVHIEEISRFKIEINHLEAIVNHIKKETAAGKKELEPNFGVVDNEIYDAMEEKLKKAY